MDDLCGIRDGRRPSCDSEPGFMLRLGEHERDDISLREVVLGALGE